MLVYTGGSDMERGDLVAIYLQGEAVLFCIIGLYQDEVEGEVMAILALIDPEQLRHIRLCVYPYLGVFRF